jgi:transposase-like protein
MSTTVKNSKMARRYGEDFKRQAVELMIRSGKTQQQAARELDVSEYSLNLSRKAYLGQMKPTQIEGQMKSLEEMAKIIREQHKEIEYLKTQREILKKSDEHPEGRTESRYAMIEQLSVQYGVN